MRGGVVGRGSDGGGTWECIRSEGAGQEFEFSVAKSQRLTIKQAGRHVRPSRELTSLKTKAGHFPPKILP